MLRILTRKQVKEIVAKYETRTSTDLAKEYGCTATNIRRVWRVNGLRGKANRSYYANFSYFSNMNTEDKAYFLGFIAADGCVSEGLVNQQKILKLSIHKKDRDVLVKFKKCIRANNPIRNIEDSKVELKISSDKLCNDLAKFNVIPRKTAIYAPVALEEGLMPHFLRGYLDGDGSIHCEAKSKPQFPSSYAVSITCNFSTANFIKGYLEAQSVAVQEIKKEKRSSIAYDVRIFNIKDIYSFLNLVYGNATVYLDRKYKMYLLYKKVYEEKYTKN